MYAMSFVFVVPAHYTHSVMQCRPIRAGCGALLLGVCTGWRSGELVQSATSPICDTRVTWTLQSDSLLIRVVCPCISCLAAWLNVVLRVSCLLSLRDWYIMAPNLAGALLGVVQISLIMVWGRCIQVDTRLTER